MQNTTLSIKSIGIIVISYLMPVIAFAQSSDAIEKTSESIDRLESEGMQPIFLARGMSTIPKAVDFFWLAAKKVTQRDYNGALGDFNRAIQLDPNFAYAYNGRGAIKAEINNDIQGGLADLNRAIQLDPNLAGAYKNRGVVRVRKLNDLQGGLADFDRAIQIDPKYSSAYALRGNLKYDRLNDRVGGIADMKEAAKLFQQQGKTNDYQKAIEKLKQWQAATNAGS
jgi:tetratricopeptide (TPR) repeat protein